MDCHVGGLDSASDEKVEWPVPNVYVGGMDLWILELDSRA
jgi:hypothetical protein